MNLCPPAPPAGPIPTPLPNMAMAADLQGGASSVTIEGNPMGKKTSFFAKSTGNEVAQSTGGGVVSHVVQGKAYFTSYSFDVTVEGEEAPRHLDMMTHNHLAQSPPNAAMGTYLAMMDPGAMPSADDAPPERPPENQTVEIFIDHSNNEVGGAMDSIQLVNTDGTYDVTLSMASASPKANLLCLKFEKVLPNKFYALYWIVGSEKITYWENVPFSQILVHTPGAEQRDPPTGPTEPPDDNPPQGYRDADMGLLDAALADHPDEWYEPSVFGKRKP